MKRESDGGSTDITFDWTEVHAPSLAVVDAVGTIRNEPPEDLPPLHGTIDAESLDSLLEHLQREGVSGEVSFEYEGYRVVLTADGRGRVAEAREGE